MEDALTWTRVRHGFWISTNGIYQIKEHKRKDGKNWWGITEDYQSNPYENEKANDFPQAKKKAEDLYRKKLIRR